MLALIVQHKSHRAFAHFRGKLVRCPARDAASCSEVGASGKLGAVHSFTDDLLAEAKTKTARRKGNIDYSRLLLLFKLALN